MPDSGEMVPMLSELGIKHEMELKLFPKKSNSGLPTQLGHVHDHAEAAALGFNVKIWLKMIDIPLIYYLETTTIPIFFKLFCIYYLN